MSNDTTVPEKGRGLTNLAVIIVIGLLAVNAGLMYLEQRPSELERSLKVGHAIENCHLNRGNYNLWVITDLKDGWAEIGRTGYSSSDRELDYIRWLRVAGLGHFTVSDSPVRYTRK